MLMMPHLRLVLPANENLSLFFAFLAKTHPKPPYGITPCKQVPESEFNFFVFSQLTTRSPELIQEFPLGHPQRHISSGEGNLRKPEYIPCRILLGLSANTIFGGV